MSIEARVRERLTSMVQRDYGGDARRLFSQVDPQGRGLDETQLRGVLDRAGVNEWPISNSRIARELLDRYDSSRDRRIQWNEFLNGGR